MNSERSQLLADMKQRDLRGDVPSISLNTAKMLHFLAQSRGAKSVLEIGTAHAYSTIWLADAVEPLGGTVMSFDLSAPSFAIAQENIIAAGLDDVVSLHFGDALQTVPHECTDQTFDIIFVDARKGLYFDFWQMIQPFVHDQTLIVFDDMIKFPEKTKNFTGHIEQQSEYLSVIIPVDGDDGVMLLQKDYKGM